MHRFFSVKVNGVSYDVEVAEVASPMTAEGKEKKQVKADFLPTEVGSSSSGDFSTTVPTSTTSTGRGERVSTYAPIAPPKEESFMNLYNSVYNGTGVSGSSGGGSVGSGGPEMLTDFGVGTVGSTETAVLDRPVVEDLDTGWTTTATSSIATVETDTLDTPEVESATSSTTSERETTEFDGGMTLEMTPVTSFTKPHPDGGETIFDFDSPKFSVGAMGGTAVDTARDTTVGSATKTGKNSVLAPLCGVITVMPIREGSKVSCGDILCVIDSDGVESEIMSPIDSEVVSVFVGTGTKVSTNDILFTLT